MTAASAITLAMLSCLAGAGVSLLAARSKTLAGWLACLATGLASGLALYSASLALTSGAGEPATLLTLPRYGSALRIAVDGLSAVFIGLIAVISLLAALYSIPYLSHYPDYGAARYYPAFLLFVGGMYGIVTVTDLMLFFCLFWQIMTLASYALVRYEYRRPENVWAANKYLLMMEGACALIMLGAGALATGDVSGPHGLLLRYDFDAISHGLPLLLGQGGPILPSGFLLLLLGFGIKAGMWPFGQLWLPDAHPAAPSPVSALLSGVMIKTGIYGLMRSFLWLVPAEGLEQFPSQTWGLLLALLGTITLFVGTMQALRQEQTKRVLAYSSIGQVGYILLGIGACLTLLGSSSAGGLALATIAFYAALFHTLNHGTFKSLLFLDAGSVLYATHTQDLNRLGGLMRRMPVTALTTLIGSLAIAGVPLCNGFASKWSLYVATILGSAEFRVLAVCAVVAILTSAITLALFMKFFGVIFLSRTSALVAAEPDSLEVGWLMRLPQMVLAALCLLVGLAPALAFGLIHRALLHSPQGLGAVLAKLPGASLVGLTGLDALGGGAVFIPLVLLAVFAGVWVLVHYLSGLGATERRVAEPWLCGYMREADQNRYVAHNLYREVTRHFRWLGAAPATRAIHADGAAPVQPSRKE